ncbi:hypothetical protein BJ095_102185 [Ureibacillus chungkukjangi]|uniref:Uncharacterized protein n=1 Tax=Ureibacillus chungkukjangi TaxID=1202712 RepID=A0A318U8U3_9BACL|nr:hypothetical protein BJ095_102185 [Ureibacillus chungkukjangi]
MSFYFPILLTIVFAVIQSLFCKHGKLFYAIALAIFFTVLINVFFVDYRFLVCLIWGNFFFYLMVVVTYFTRSAY